jgi:hypothetical protein
MAFFDRLIGDPRQRQVQQQRAAGEGTLARRNFAQQRAANAAAANATASRLTDSGGNPALAGRTAAQQQGAANAAAGQMFASQQTAEMQRAEAQLADMRAQRQGFFRNMLGAGLRTGAAFAGQYMQRPGGLLDFSGGSGGPNGLPASGVVMGPNGPVTGPTGQGVNAGNMGNRGGMGDGLLLQQAAPIAGMALGGPMGAVLGQGLASAVTGQPQAPTMGLVDQAMAGAPQGVPALAEGVTDTYGAGLTDDEYLQWLMANRGGI